VFYNNHDGWSLKLITIPTHSYIRRFVLITIIHSYCCNLSFNSLRNACREVHNNVRKNKRTITAFLNIRYNTSIPFCCYSLTSNHNNILISICTAVVWFLIFNNNIIILKKKKNLTVWYNNINQLKTTSNSLVIR